MTGFSNIITDIEQFTCGVPFCVLLKDIITLSELCEGVHLCKQSYGWTQPKRKAKNYIEIIRPLAYTKEHQKSNARVHLPRLIIHNLCLECFGVLFGVLVKEEKSNQKVKDSSSHVKACVNPLSHLSYCERTKQKLKRFFHEEK